MINTFLSHLSHIAHPASISLCLVSGWWVCVCVHAQHVRWFESCHLTAP